MLPNEKELISKSREGDAEAFGALYDHYVRVVYNFVYYKTYHKDTAEDLTSETFLKALKNIKSADPERSILPWLMTIARNCVIDNYRRKRPSEDIDDFWDIRDESVDIEGDLDTKSRVLRLRSELRKLPSKERDIIIMRVWQELPYKEIAAITGKSEASCKMSFSRSLSKLREAMPEMLALLILLSNHHA